MPDMAASTTLEKGRAWKGAPGGLECAIDVDRELVRDELAPKE